MVNKKLTIKGEKAVVADIKSAVSIAFFEEELSVYDGTIDEDVRRAVIYNKVVIENLMKRLMSYGMYLEDSNNEVKIKQKKLHRIFGGENKWHYSKLYYAETEDNSFDFLKDVLDKNKKVRGYSEYILYSLFAHYFDYTKN